MLPYFFVNFTVSLIAILENKRNSKYLFFIVIFAMLLFSALREGGTGTGDYDAYIRLYNLFDSVDDIFSVKAHVEPGFRFLSVLGNTLGFEGQFIIAAMALLSLLPVAYIIYKKSKYRLLSLVVWLPYFLAMNMHSSRISVAAAFGLVCLIAIVDKRYFSALVFFVLSVLFHTSALILAVSILVFLPFAWLVLLLIFSIVISLVIDPFILLSQILNVVGLQKASGFIMIYLNSSDYGYPMPIYDPRILLSLLVSFLIIKAYKKDNAFNKEIYKMYIIGAFLMLIFSGVTVLAWRASYFYLIVGVLVVPEIVKKYDFFKFNDNKVKRVMAMCGIFIYCLWTSAFIIKAEPYKIFL